MNLGQRIRTARLDAGLSQRQLCGDTITRNMLSQIEHGTVQPSVGTLCFLAGRLGKPVSYFLDEEAVTSPNMEAMAVARACFAEDDPAGALNALEQYREPDETFDWERRLLAAKCCLSLAAQAIAQERLPYASELLRRAKQAGDTTPYYGAELERQRLLLLAQAEPEEEISLPSDDLALLIRAKAALAAGNPARCARLLDAAEEQSAQWHYLRGEAWFAERNYARAVECYQQAEMEYPKQTAARLEQCFRELEDFKMAYYYACKQRS